MSPTVRRLVTGDRRWASLLFLAAVHRGVLFGLYKADLDRLIAAAPDRLMVQYLSLEALRDLPALSLLHLQQTPPLPNLLLAGVLQLASWPFTAAYALLALQAALTVVSAMLLMRLADRIFERPSVSLGLAVLWVLNPDRLVLEVHSAGQQLHEALAMVLLLTAALLFERWISAGTTGRAVALGSSVALLALTRASYSYFALPMLILLAFVEPRRRCRSPYSPLRRTLRMLVAFLAPIALLHGGWALKNLAVHGDFRLATSTWAGANAVAGLAGAGFDEPLADHILAHRGVHPPWFTAFVERQGIRPWAFTWEEDETLLPTAARRRDASTQGRLHGTDRPENGARQRVLADAFLGAWWRYGADHPHAVARKLRLGYALYWFPIRYAARREVGLFATEWRVDRSFRVPTLVGQVLRGELPEGHLVTSGAWPDLERYPARFFTLDLPVTLLWIVQIVTLHLLLPVVLVVLAWTAWRRRSLAVIEPLFLFLITAIAYSALVHNLVEMGENMRFRMAVEPLGWLLSWWTLRYTARVFRRRQPARAAQATSATPVPTETARPTTNERGL